MSDHSAGSPSPAKAADLPYTDTKPQGSPDFFYGINSTLRFIRSRLGPDAWVRYLEAMGREYFAPANARWREGGLPAVARYWRAFFAAEPGAEVAVEKAPGRVVLEVRVCPAIRHLRAGGREILREYCQHCYYLGNARAAEAGLAMRLEGGAGSCRHTYYARPSDAPAQDLSRIKEVAP